MLKLKTSKFRLIKRSGFLCVSLLIIATIQANAFELNKSQDYSDHTFHSEYQIPVEDLYSSELRTSDETRFYTDRFAQNQRNSDYRLRSKSEVVREVKQRYNAEVLKISLNQQRATYQVRILLPNGRVKQISVSARR